MTRFGLATMAKRIATPRVAANVPQNMAVTSAPKKEKKQIYIFIQCMSLCNKPCGLVK